MAGKDLFKENSSMRYDVYDLLRQAQFALFGRFVFAVDPSNILRITPIKNLVAAHADKGCIKGVSGEASIKNI